MQLGNTDRQPETAKEMKMSNRTNEEMEFGLVEVFGVRKDGKKQMGNEDHSFGTMGYSDANTIKQNHESGKPWMSQYSGIYFRSAK